MKHFIQSEMKAVGWPLSYYKRFDVSSEWGAEERRASGREVTLQFDKLSSNSAQNIEWKFKDGKISLIYFENLHEEARVIASRKWTQ